MGMRSLVGYELLVFFDGSGSDQTTCSTMQRTSASKKSANCGCLGQNFCGTRMRQAMIAAAVATRLILRVFILESVNDHTVESCCGPNPLLVCILARRGGVEKT